MHPSRSAMVAVAALIAALVSPAPADADDHLIVYHFEGPVRAHGLAVETGFPTGTVVIDSSVEPTDMGREFDRGARVGYWDAVEGSTMHWTRDPRIGSNRRISGSRATADEHQPAMAYNSRDDEYLVVWADLRREETRGWDIYGQRVDATGERRGANFRISGTLAKGDEWQPSVAYNANDNEYVVLWMDGRRASGTAVYGQRLAADGERSGPNFRVAGKAAIDSPQGNRFIPVGGPDVAHNPVGNEYVAVWPGRRNPDTQVKHIQARRLSAEGVRLGRPFPVTRPIRLSDARWPAVAHDAVNDRYLVAWSDDRELFGGDWGIVGQLLGGDGDPIGGNYRLSGREAFHTKAPTVTFDSTNERYLVVWEDDRNVSWPTIGPTVYGRLFDADGGKLGPDFSIDSEQSGGGAPAVAFNEVGDEYLVVYGQWGRRLTLDGDPTTDEFPLLDVQGVLGPPGVAVAHGAGADEYLVVWPDRRSAETRGVDIFGQGVAG